MLKVNKTALIYTDTIFYFLIIKKVETVLLVDSDKNISQ